MRRFLHSGEPFIWLSGAALALCLLMIAGLVVVVVVNGLGIFWPSELVELELDDGQRLLGQQTGRQAIPAVGTDETVRHRLQYKVGNRDVYGLDFRWIDEADIVGRQTPGDAVVIERLEWGNLHGRLRAVYEGEQVLGRGDEAEAALKRAIAIAHGLDEQIAALEQGDMGEVNAAIEALRMRLRGLELEEGPTAEGNLPERRDLELDGGSASERDQLESRRQALWARYETLSNRTSELREQRERFQAEVEVPGGGLRRLAAGDVVRIYWPNRLGLPGKLAVYTGKFWEFLSGEPRESNTEGGIFPALFGTVMMVILMSLAVVPFGVLAALYLREYAKQGALVRAIRIAVNNLAGVPSIVFGMFGLGFFVYGVGGTIDLLLYPESLPTPTYGTGGILWASLTLALLTLPVVIVATEEALSSVPAGVREGSLALGSTQLQMIWRVVLPSALPGILTGVILATARGAGEVAPLMITGVVKLAPDLPLDAVWPFLHLERKFMHLGFHIYDVGFQSPNVEAARPMVYTTTFLLLMVVLILNLTAIVVRNRLRKRYALTGF